MTIEVLSNKQASICEYDVQYKAVMLLELFMYDARFVHHVAVCF